MGILSNAFAKRPPPGAREVLDSPDFQRVNSLPWRPIPGAAAQRNMARYWTDKLRLPDSNAELRPIQGWAIQELHEAAQVRRGALLPMGVGSGKTLVSLLAPTLYQAARPVLFTYAALLEKTRRELSEEYGQDWVLRGVHILSWETLSSPAGAQVLEELDPDLVIADEVHAVKDPAAARTRRFLRFFESRPQAPLVALSGSITSHSLSEFAHIAALCLDTAAPVPLNPDTLQDWCRALDEGVNYRERMEPGVLSCWAHPGQSVREAFRARMLGTPGIVSTQTSALDSVGLNIYTTGRLYVGRIRDLLQGLNSSGRDPDGNELESPTDAARVAKTLALGYWLRWAWPGGTPDLEWLAARNAWNREVRAFLGAGGGPGMDSPGLVAAAHERGHFVTTALARAWAAWAPVRHRPPPPVVPVFDSQALDQLARYVRDWALPAGGIVWIPSPHLGAELAARAGLPWFPAGTDPSTSRAGAILASQQAHGVGKNLQHWARNLVLVPPASGKSWEQLLGRTHRPGQRADTVEVTACLHHGALRNAFETAQREAVYIQQVTGNVQKLCLATVVKG
jgi:hypothetical protein